MNSTIPITFLIGMHGSSRFPYGFPIHPSFWLTCLLPPGFPRVPSTFPAWTLSTLSVLPLLNFTCILLPPLHCCIPSYWPLSNFLGSTCTWSLRCKTVQSFDAHMKENMQHLPLLGLGDLTPYIFSSALHFSANSMLSLFISKSYSIVYTTFSRSVYQLMDIQINYVS